MWGTAFKLRLLLAALGPFMAASSGYPVSTANTEQCQVVNGSSSNKSFWNPQLPGPLQTLPLDSVPIGLDSVEKQPEQLETTRRSLDARLNVVLVLDPPFWGPRRQRWQRRVWLCSQILPRMATAIQPPQRSRQTLTAVMAATA